MFFYNFIKIQVDILIRRAGTGPRYGLKNHTYNLVWIRIRCRSAIRSARSSSTSTRDWRSNQQKYPPRGLGLRVTARHLRLLATALFLLVARQETARPIISLARS